MKLDFIQSVAPKVAAVAVCVGASTMAMATQFSLVVSNQPVHQPVYAQPHSGGYYVGHPHAGRYHPPRAYPAPRPYVVVHPRPTYYVPPAQVVYPQPVYVAPPVYGKPVWVRPHHDRGYNRHHHYHDRPSRHHRRHDD